MEKIADHMEHIALLSDPVEAILSTVYMSLAATREIDVLYGKPLCTNTSKWSEGKSWNVR